MRNTENVGLIRSCERNTQKFVNPRFPNGSLWDNIIIIVKSLKDFGIPMEETLYTRYIG